MINGVTSTNFTFSKNFISIVGAKSPRFIVFTEASLEPRIAAENYSIVQGLAVADFNQDGLDDVIVSYGDVYTKPRLYLSNGDGTFRFAPEWMPDGSERRLIRNFSVEDINADGRPDFVGFAAPHGFYENILGSLWDGKEPDLLLINQGNRFQIVPLHGESYHHGGSVGDLNQDGLIDIFGVGEFPSWHSTFTPRSPLYQSAEGQFTTANWSIDRIFPEAVISSLQIADLNNDSVDDIVMSVSYQKKIGASRTSSPMDSELSGVIAYAFGASGKNFSELPWRTAGKHWMSESEWKEFAKTYDPTNIDANNLQTGPSLIETIDVNGDNLLDILVSFYISTPRLSWRTSGFIYLENNGLDFTDKTDLVFPNQASNRNIVDLAKFAIGFDMPDIDGDGDRDFIQTTLSHENIKGREDKPSSIVFINDQGVYTPPLWRQLIFRHSDGSYTDSSFKNLSTGDFNGDGAPDLISIGYSTDSHILISHLNLLSRFDSSTEFRGGPGNEKIDLSANSRTIARGGAGNDEIVGKVGRVDSAIYWGSRNDYKVVLSTDRVTVTALKGNEGADSLKLVDRVVFSDLGLALDLDGNAGTTAKILGAVFGKGAVANKAYAGIGLHYLDSLGYGYDQLMGLAINAALGPTPTNGQVVDLLYKNVVGVLPDAATKAMFVGMLDRKEQTIGSLGVLAAETDLNKANIDLVGLVKTGLEYLPFQS